MSILLKKQNGIAAIAIIIIVVLSAAAGGATFLGVKSAVTGEPFMQPFEDMGLVEIDEEEEKTEKIEKIEKNEDEEKTEKNDKDEQEEFNNEEKAENDGDLSLPIDDSEPKKYTVVVDLKEVADGMVPVIEELLSMYMDAGSDMIDQDTSYEDAAMQDLFSEVLSLISDMFVDCEITIDCVANGNDISNVLVTIPYEKLVKNVYNKLSEIEELMKEIDPTADLGIEYGSYEEMLSDLENAIKEELTTEELRDALVDELGTEYQEIIDAVECKIEDKKIKISADLSTIDFNSYIEPYRTEIEELGIDPDNVVESAVEIWNEYIDDIGYDGLIEEAFSMIMGTYNMLSF